MSLFLSQIRDTRSREKQRKPRKRAQRWKSKVVRKHAHMKGVTEYRHGAKPRTRRRRQ